MDYSLLREKGLEHIEKLGSKIWTDYNIHDPGITILEALCYAITDLGYRTNFEMRDILAEPEDSTAGPQFFEAHEILSCNPVTENDFRKIIIDIDKVKNAWLSIIKDTGAYEPTVYASAGLSKLGYDPAIYTHRIYFKGLYNILIELDVEAEDIDTPAKKTAVENEVKTAVLRKLHQTRNLCEDYINVDFIDIEEIGVCTDIEIDNDSDVNEILAGIYFKIHQFLSPPVKFYTLAEMIDKKYKPDEIFNGPLLKNGFIDSSELEKTKLADEIHISDLYQVLMDIPGVRSIKKLLLSKYQNDSIVINGEPWILDLDPPDYKPELSFDKSSIRVFKDIIPYSGDKDLIREKFELLKLLERQSAVKNAENQIKIRKGTYGDLQEYTSILHEFPLTYGVGTAGLPETVSERRKAQAKQLKGYLLFFDQVLANYLAQLAKVKDLLSVNNDTDQTYFTQHLEDVPDYEELIYDVETNGWGNFDLKIDSIIEDPVTKNNRLHRLLNHLMARFGEKFTDYTLMMYDLYSSRADADIINDKREFLKSYPRLSSNRGKAFNYLLRDESFGQPDMWNSTNVSGLVARVSKLLGIENYTRRSLACPPVYKLDKVRRIGIGPGISNVYRLRIKNSTNKVLLTGARFYPSSTITRKFAMTVSDILHDEDNYKIRTNSAGKYAVYVYNDSGILFARSKWFDTSENANQLMAEVISNVCPEKECSNEGFHLVEHILLRPKKTTGGNNYSLFPILVQGEDKSPVCMKCEGIFDPYSFRISVVIPYWPERFQNMEFREFFEKTLRMETPAHIAVKICWVDCMQLYRFENAFKNWLLEHAKGPDADPDLLCTRANELIDILFKLRSVYPEAVLHNCRFEDNATVLNRTAIGEYKEDL